MERLKTGKKPLHLSHSRFFSPPVAFISELFSAASLYLPLLHPNLVPSSFVVLETPKTGIPFDSTNKDKRFKTDLQSSWKYTTENNVMVRFNGSAVRIHHVFETQQNKKNYLED